MATTSKPIICFAHLRFLFFSSIILLCLAFQEPQEVGRKAGGKMEVDTSLANQYLAQVDSLLNQAAFEKAIDLILQAKVIYQAAEAWPLYVSCYNLLARCYDYQLDIAASFEMLLQAEDLASQYWPLTMEALANTYQQKAELYIQLDQQDSALVALTQANDLFVRQKDWEGSAWAQILMAISYYYQVDFAKMDSLLAKVYALDEKHHFPPKSEIRETVFQWQQLLYEESGAYEKAFALAKQTLAERLGRLNSNFDSLMLATDYHNLGAIYQGKGDYDEAIRYYKLALIVQSQIVVEAEELYEEYLHIGLCLNEKGKPQEALPFFYQSLAALSEYPISAYKNDYAATYVAMGRAHIENERADSAIYYLQTALSIAPAEYRAEDVVWLNLGLAYQIKRNWSKAKKCFLKALATHQQTYNSDGYKNHPIQVNLHQYLGEVYLAEGKAIKAIASFQRALQLLDQDFTSDNYFENPPREKVVDKLRFLTLLSLKIRTLLDHPEIKLKAEKIYPSLRLAVALIDDIRQDYASDGGRQMLSERGHAIYEMGIELTLQLYQQTGEKQFLEEAFLYTEKSKGLLLLASIKQAAFSKTYQQASFDTLHQAMKTLALDIRFYERKLLATQQVATPDQQKKKKWEDILSQRRAAYEQRRYQMEREFPDYYTLNFGTDLATVKDLQTHLSTIPNTALVEYFWGEYQLYIFVITTTSIKTYQYPRSPQLDQHIHDFLNLQRTNPNYANPSNTISNHLAAYTQTAHALYQELLEPALPTKAIDKLIVIPDGILTYLSFEALLSEATPAKYINYQKNRLPYLIKQYQFSYAYSGSLLMESLQQKKTKASQNYAGFAPVFEQGREKAANRTCTDELELTLANSTKSISLAQGLFGGRAFLHEAASKQNFLTQAANFRLLHLATHACLDEEEVMYSKIHFAQEDLYLYELYSLALNAELVVLSACETGVGKLVRGEGVYSLTRGFMQAGCPAVITSLWNANDFATSQIMMQFHENLQKGQAKGEALRNAKLSYLDQAPSRYSAPYFWATFISIGNNTPFEMNSSSTFSFLLPLAFLCILMVVFLYSKQKRSVL